jgi:hypothetical protein
LVGQEIEKKSNMSEENLFELEVEVKKEKKNIEKSELVEPILTFYKKNTIYEYMPKSTKVIVFDLDTLIKEAFSVVEETSLFFFKYRYRIFFTMG